MVLGGGQGLTGNKGGQWSVLAPKQAVQCPEWGWTGEAVLDAEGLLGLF